jgi:Kef-type K+ transport system membrane component KefB
MFVIGMELDIKVLKNKASEAVVISHASIVIPLRWVLVCLILCLTDLPEGSVSFFSLFMGIAMSITAFQFWRIVQEREIHKTKLGAIVITCAADDDTAWCLLAVIAIVKAEILSARYMLFSLQFMCW